MPTVHRILLALVLASLAGCGSGRSPTAAAMAVVEAAHDGDGDAVLQLLGPRTRARLETNLRRAREQSGARDLQVVDLLGVGWSSPRFRPIDARVRDRQGDHATVELRGRQGELERVETVRGADGWKVELP